MNTPRTFFNPNRCRGAGCTASAIGRLWPAVVLIFGLLPGLFRVPALQAAEEVFSTRSVSGQFVIQYRPTRLPPLSLPRLETNLAFVRLDAALVPVSCERIRQHVWRELGITGRWQSKIFLGLRPVTGPDDVATISCERFRDGWQYKVDMPDLVERTRYLRAMVRVLLLEYANRNSAGRSSEVPAWLVEGLVQEMLVSNDLEIILPPPRAVANAVRIGPVLVDARRVNPLEAPHVQLSTHTPLTFEQLSWPRAEDLEGPAADLYRNCAQLFINSLANLPDGRVALRTMLERLPNYMNWQFAFLDAFQNWFQRPLDVEKWWALKTVLFTGRDLAQSWNPSQSWDQLLQALRVPVRIHSTTNQLPLQAEVNLQTIVARWEAAEQTPALQRVLSHLNKIQYRAAPELLPLVDDYRQTLREYLDRRDHPGFVLPFRKKAVLRELVAETVRRLDALDARSRAMRAAPNPALSVELEAVRRASSLQ